MQTPTLSLGAQVVWSDGANTLFHPMMAPVSSAGVKYVRVDTEQRNRTANAKIRIAARCTDDGVTFSGTTWIDVPALFQTMLAFIQLGVECGGTTAGQNELCLATIKVDIKAQ